MIIFAFMTKNSIIIADAGGTKTAWLKITEGDWKINFFQTGGINAVTTPTEKIHEHVADACAQIATERVKKVIFYGAGCISPEACQRVESELRLKWRDAIIEVASDMLGASRALLGRSPGIACILGTGANSALYDGTKITDNTPSMGYILGDEGSGAAIGKRFISDVFKQVAPQYVVEKFHKQFGITLPQVIENTYRGDAPPMFLAGVLPYIHENLGDEYYSELVKDEFKRFFKRNVIRYEGAGQLPICFTGSVAYNFAGLLAEAASECGLWVEKVQKSPLEGLVAYHMNNFNNIL